MYPTIESLGECLLTSPLRHIGPGATKFKTDSERILCDHRSNADVEVGTSSSALLTFEVAGPRERIYFDPAHTVAAVVTCARGPQKVTEMVDGLEELGVDMLFAIGGDGTLKGTAALVSEIQRRGLKKSVVGIPKTIDNDSLHRSQILRDL